MRYFLGLVLFNLCSVVALPAATLPILYIDQPVIGSPPPIDATRVVNRNLFDIQTVVQPYQMLNTLFFTNTAAGTMRGTPGFRYDFFTANSRQAMNTWVNQGTNAGTTWLMVWATNIVSTGPIIAGPSGLLRLEGKNITLTRNGLRAGLEPGVSFGDGFTFINSSNYFNPPGISDVYWGTGTNNALDNMGMPMVLGLTNSGFPGTFEVPCTISPFHEVHDTRIFGGGGTFTNVVTVPDIFFFGFGNTCFNEFDAHAYTAPINSTSRLVQVAFVSKNLFDTNFTTRVRFVPDVIDFGSARFDAGHTIMVEFGSVERDLLNGRFSTNTLYFIDRSAFTNAYLQRPIFGATRKPSTYEVRRSTPFGFTNANTFAANTVYSPSLLYNGTFASNTVDVGYSAYRFRLASTGETNLTGTLVRHPTNTPGRVEIIGDNVNLDRARIRAESTAIIRAKNLVGNSTAQVDAPFAAYDLGSTNPPLVISNLAPPFVQRLSGEVAAWSATWDNYEITANSTNLVRFHVLVLENALQSIQPVVITELALRSPHVVISDNVSVSTSFFTDASSLHIAGTLNLPFGMSWDSNNVPKLINFTNDGILNISGAGKFGTDRKKEEGYGNFINRGTNIATSFFIKAGRFENTGCLLANSGPISIEADNVRIQGGPSSISTNLVTNTVVIGNVTFTNVFLAVVTNIPGKIQANSDVQITAGDMVAIDSYIRAGAGSSGALLLDIDNRLADGGPGTSNYWAATAGFHLAKQKTVSGDLLATHITSMAPNEQQEVFHSWPAEDRGASVAGFNNNLALGKLTLDGAANTLFHFNPGGGKTRAALYVDYLELLNNATNFTGTNSAFNIATNMTIYFANANLSPSKIEANPGLVWVKDFAGPLSSTNIVYPSPPYPTGTVVTANIALATSKDFDSDGDGISNADDPDPFFISQSVGLAIEISKSGDAFLSWNALARATNILECATTPDTGNWNTITNFIQGEQTTRVRVRESLSNTNQRIYRVRVDAGEARQLNR
jgi:hypothetical protein